MSSAPKDGRRIMVWEKDFGPITVKYEYNVFRLSPQGDYVEMEYTYGKLLGWMELPQEFELDEEENAAKQKKIPLES